MGFHLEPEKLGLNRSGSLRLQQAVRKERGVSNAEKMQASSAAKNNQRSCGETHNAHQPH